MKSNIGFCAMFCLALLFSSFSLASDSKHFSEAAQHCTASIGTTLAGVDANSVESSYARRGMTRIGKNIRLTYVLKKAKADSAMPKRVVCQFDRRKKIASLKTS